MDIEKLLNNILRQYRHGLADNNIMQGILRKIESGKATYADAQKYAIQAGKILTGSLRQYLPEALTDGRLYRAFADVLVKTPMQLAGQDVAQVAAAIQDALNEAAEIGLRAIIPELNDDQLTGIITGIVNAESYEHNIEEFMDQLASMLEGYVDDFVRENAEFQHEAGLSPTVQRIADANCCSWCSRLAGTYNYDDVSDKGNEVWQRHNNCHCQIIYSPAGSKRRYG